VIGRTVAAYRLRSPALPLQQYTLAGIVIITFFFDRYIMFVAASFFRARLLVIHEAAHPWWHVEDKRESKNLATIINHTVGA
jgi:hypothetical protein